MNKLLIPIISIFAMLSVSAQNIRKVNGIKYTEINICMLPHGYMIGAGYGQYIAKNVNISALINFENSKVKLTNYRTYSIHITGEKSFLIPLNGFYTNVNASLYGGLENVSNKYFTNENKFSVGISFGPEIEYFFLDNISLILGLNTFLDFTSSFRDYHYLYKISFTYIIN